MSMAKSKRSEIDNGGTYHVVAIEGKGEKYVGEEVGLRIVRCREK